MNNNNKRRGLLVAENIKDAHAEHENKKTEKIRITNTNVRVPLSQHESVSAACP